MGVQGLDRLLEQLNNLKDIDPVPVASAGGYKLLAESQKLAPVKTGYLRSSGGVEQVPGQGCNMFFSAEYSWVQEMKYHPFVRPAIDNKSDDIVKAMKDEAEKQIKKGVT